MCMSLHLSRMNQFKVQHNSNMGRQLNMKNISGFIIELILSTLSLDSIHKLFYPQQST